MIERGRLFPLVRLNTLQTGRKKERKREEIIDGSMYKMNPSHIPMSMKVSCFKLAFWQLNIML